MANWWESTPSIWKENVLPGEGGMLTRKTLPQPQSPLAKQTPPPVPNYPNPPPPHKQRPPRPELVNWNPNPETTWRPADEYLPGFARLDTTMRNELEFWESSWRDVYLKAMTAGEGLLYFNGSDQRGVDIANQIEQMYRQHYKELHANREMEYRLTPYIPNRI